MKYRLSFYALLRLVSRRRLEMLRHLVVDASNFSSWVDSQGIS